MYRVTFWDANGAFLGECCVPHGKTAFPPEKPCPPKGWRFDRWEPQVSYVLCHTQTQAVYVPCEYLVTFLSETGAVLKREYVPHGKDATPPAYRPCAAWSGRVTNIQRPQVFYAVPGGFA
jgi:hypothetical protein